MPRYPLPRDACTHMPQCKFRHVEGCDPANTEPYWQERYPDTNWVCTSASARDLGCSYQTLQDIMTTHKHCFHCHQQALLNENGKCIGRVIVSHCTSVAAGLEAYKHGVTVQRVARAKTNWRHWTWT